MGLVNQWDPDRVLIEDAASGKPLFDELFRDDRRRYERCRPDKDKETRFQSACAPVEEGKVNLPSESSWLPAFKRELQSFPRGRYDDQVDSFSQFLNLSKGTGFYRALDRDHPVNIARREKRGARPRRQ